MTSDQVIVAAEVVPENTDWMRFIPCWTRPAQLDAAAADPIRAVVADAGYSNKQNRTRLPREGTGPILLVAVPRLVRPGRGPVRKSTQVGEDPS